jgi:hypothetical protein
VKPVEASLKYLPTDTTLSSAAWPSRLESWEDSSRWTDRPSKKAPEVPCTTFLEQKHSR